MFLRWRSLVHHGHTPEIEVLAQTTARGIWAMADFVEPGQASDGVPFEGAGYCREEYRKVDGSWRISRLHLTRLTRIEMAG